MLVGHLARRIARIAQRCLAPRATGIALYSNKQYAAARPAFTRALRRGADRSTWLYAASVEDRLKNSQLRDKYLATAQQLYPPTGYDFTAALSNTLARPKERDDIAQFAVRNAAVLARTATQLAARSHDTPRYAFVYWDSEYQPDVVKHCIAAMREHLPADLTLIELNA